MNSTSLSMQQIVDKRIEMLTALLMAIADSGGRLKCADVNNMKVHELLDLMARNNINLEATHCPPPTPAPRPTPCPVARW